MSTSERYNPAVHLLDVLTSWAVPPDQTTEQARGDASARDAGFWRAHVALVSDLTEIERAMRELEIDGHNVDRWRRFLPELYRAVFAVNTPWSTGGGLRPALDDSHMLGLEGIVQTLNQRQAARPVEGSTRSKLGEQLTAARQLVALAGPDDLNAETRAYLLTVLDDALNAVEQNQTAWEQRSAVQQATGAMLAVSARPPQLAQQRQSTFLRRLGTAALSILVVFGGAFAESMGSGLGELTVDSFVHFLTGPESIELEPGPAPIELEPGQTQVINEDGTPHPE